MLQLPTPHDATPSFGSVRTALDGLRPTTTPRWGRMSATQMLVHCCAFHRLCLGELRPGAPTRWIARLLGPMFLRRFLRGSPFETPKNLRTLAEIRAPSELGADDVSEFDANQSALLATIDALERLDGIHRHPLYGPMRPEDVRAIARHHLGHHFHQFGLLGPEAARSPARPAVPAG